MQEYIKRMRAIVGTERLLVPSTACIIPNDRGEILLQCRADNGLWGCAGGIMDIGETVLENLGREVMEETGLTIRSARLFGIYSGSRFEYQYPNGDRTAIVQYVFIADDATGTPAPDAESKELRYFAIDALPEQITSMHAEFLRHYVEYVAGERAIPVII